MNKVLLKDLCIKGECGKYGIPASAEKFSLNKTRYLRITDISEEGKLLENDKKSVTSKDIGKYLLKEGDIVFARTGNSTGKTYYHENKNGRLAFAGFLIKYSLDAKKINPKYLRYYTISNEYKQWVENLSLGSTRGNINAETFRNLPINLPERKQQDLLVDILSTLDKKIELNNKINAELEKMAKTLYDYWFVQFDFPDKNGKPYKSSGGKMVYSEKLKRGIPITGKEDANFATEKGQYNFFTCGEDILKCDEYKFEGKAILIAGNGNFNIKLYEGRFNAYQRTYILIPNNEEHYTVVYLATKDRIDSFTKGSRGSIVKFITKGDIENIQIPMPKSNFSKNYNALNNITKKIELNIKENQKLAELRDWLLPMLMNGQVEVE